jgi:hypothetical protein
MLAGRRVGSWLGGTVVAASLAACGGASGPTGIVATPSPTPTPCSQVTIIQEPAAVPGRTLVYEDFSVPENGRLDVTMDWTFPASPIGFYLVPANTCTLDEFNARSCNFLIRSETTSKPRKISTPGFSAGNYRWLVGNFSEDQESVSLLIVLAKGGCPALGGPPAASGLTDRAWPSLERAQPR